MTSDPIDVFGPFDDLITQPLEPTVLNNAVVVIGLGPVALAMTADAAEISGLRLMDAAAKAREKILAGLLTEKHLSSIRRFSTFNDGFASFLAHVLSHAFNKALALPVQFRNLLLQALLEGGAAELPTLLREVHLQKGEVAVSEDTVPHTIYFPGTAVLSAVKIMSDGRAVEVATQGYEGASGLLAALSSSRPTLRMFAQIAGSAIAVPAEAFCALAYRDDIMMRTILRSLAIATDQAEQSVACLALHDVPGRAARWILQTQDRTSSTEFPLTQENLALMIGVQRTTVNAAAMVLKGEGMIAYSRGSVRVVDREALKRRACECYHSVEERWHGDPLSLIQV